MLLIIDKFTEFCRDFELSQPYTRENTLEKAITFITEEIKETEVAIQQQDRAEIIDGFGDVAFIAINGIYKEFRTMGDDHSIATKKVAIVLERICNANLGKKQKDGTVLYKNGKVQKPKEWTPPAYDDLL